MQYIALISALRELVGHPEVTLVRESDSGPLAVEATKAAARNRWVAVVFISVQSVFHCRFRKVSEGHRIQYGTLVQFPYLLTHPEIRFPVQDLMEAYRSLGRKPSRGSINDY